MLATSLLNRKKFPHSVFSKLYYQRWKVETYFHTLKSHLSIDNFTGRTVEGIMQDFYSTIFVSGIESIVVAEADEDLKTRPTKHQLKVNKAVSFHTIKNHVIRLIFEKPPGFEDQITELLLCNPTSVRPGREKPPRSIVDNDRANNRKSLYFQRFARKHVF